MKNQKGKTVAKENLPSKVCVVCHRPFTWRKKWERVWDEVTTCSKSCNAKRKQMAKQQQQVPLSLPLPLPSQKSLPGSASCCDNDSASVGSAASGSGGDGGDDDDPRRALRKQRKEALRARKQARRLKRMGVAPSDVGRKPCDLCATPSDLLIRCTVDESGRFRMVCGRCWRGVSGGVPDGVAATHPHYRYGGLWKNRSADLPKKVGSGRAGSGGAATEGPGESDATADATAESGPAPSTLVDEIERSLREVAVVEDGDGEA